jgi:hypothetical protein
MKRLKPWTYEALTVVLEKIREEQPELREWSSLASNYSEDLVVFAADSWWLGG